MSETHDRKSERYTAQEASRMAKAIAVLCVRNTFLEDLHAGKAILSATGDYSDVKVVMPSSEVPWNDISHISDAEMKRLMKEVVNRVYTVLMTLDNDQAMQVLFDKGQAFAAHWDEPEFLPKLLKKFGPSGDAPASVPSI